MEPLSKLDGVKVLMILACRLLPTRFVGRFGRIKRHIGLPLDVHLMKSVGPDSTCCILAPAALRQLFESYNTAS